MYYQKRLDIYVLGIKRGKCTIKKGLQTHALERFGDIFRKKGYAP